MSAAAQQLLDSFDSLAEADKHQVAIEILHRVAGAGNSGICPRTRWSKRQTNSSALLMSKRRAMPRADRGSVWIVDLGMTAKVRPVWYWSVPTDRWTSV